MYSSGSMLALIGVGIGPRRRRPAAAGHRRRRAQRRAGRRRSGVLLLMRAFADGCTAITGVEAVSNGVPAFKRVRVVERPDDV